MAKLTLKRLFKRKDFITSLEDLIESRGKTACIKDETGEILIGTTLCSGHHEHPIIIDGQLAGWVVGKENDVILANLVTSLGRCEMEKRAVGQEALNKYKEITLLYDCSERIAACLNTSEVANLLIEETRRIIKSTNVSVMLFDEKLGTLNIIAALGNEYSPKKDIRPGEGIAGLVFSTGKAEIVNNVKSDSRYREGKNKTRSLLCIPLKTKGDSFGVLNISTDKANRYSAEDLKVASTIAFQGSIAIENAQLYENLKETFFTTVRTLAEAIEKRDSYTGGHTKRVMDYSVSIGVTMGLSNENIEQLRLSAILHDIGKIGVRDDILLKQEKLTIEEYELLKKHPVYGEEILKFIKQLNGIIPGVKYHHEFYNGQGYPDGLKGDEINIIARIIAVADSFDAMTTERPYQKGLSVSEAVNELKKNSGVQFDPAVVDAFFSCYPELT